MTLSFSGDVDDHTHRVHQNIYFLYVFYYSFFVFFFFLVLLYLCDNCNIVCREIRLGPSSIALRRQPRMAALIVRHCVDTDRYILLPIKQQQNSSTTEYYILIFRL